MEAITQSYSQTNIENSDLFDKESRENYFEMLEKAFVNLSLVDHKMEELEELVQE